MDLTVRFTHDTLKTFGNFTLIGMISEMLSPAENLLSIKMVTLEFEQTSYNFRYQNGGPLEISIPEYAPMCLIQDILSLIRHGISVSIKTIEVM